MASNNAKSNHISNMRNAYSQVLDAHNKLIALVNEANDNGYTFSAPDFVGDNAGINPTDYTTALTQATNWTAALINGVNVGAPSSTTLPAGLRGVFTKVAK